MGYYNTRRPQNRGRVVRPVQGRLCGPGVRPVTSAAPHRHCQAALLQLQTLQLAARSRASLSS